MGFKIPNFYKQMSSNSGPMKKSSSISPLNVTPPNRSSSDKPKRSFDEAYEKRDQKTYGSMSKEEYIKEAKRQKKSKEDGKGYDAPSKPITKAKVKNDKPAETTKATETKDDKPKTKTRKQMRAEKRVGRLKKKQEKKGSLTPGQQKRLDRNKSKAKGEEVKEKDRTNVGKAIKKGVDKVKDVVSKDSPAEKMDEVSTGKKTRKEFNKMQEQK